jgi:formylglycine-generating enzyme required for sulfatase activity
MTGGISVFALAAPAQALEPARSATGGADKETVFWQSIQGSANPADFQAYLRQFPGGTFAPLARNRLAAVRPAPKPKPVPSQAKPAVGVYPERHKPGEVFKDCAGCPEMVVVPTGSFTMGSPAGEKGRDDDEGPQRRVSIPRPFAVGKYEVTQAEWRAVMGTNPCRFKGEATPWNK